MKMMIKIILFDLMYEKSLATHQKLAMMSFAKSKFIKCKNDFGSIQNMDFPIFGGMAKTQMLFYF